MNQVGQTSPSSLYEVLEHLRQRQATQAARYYYYPSLLTVVVECSSILQSKRGSDRYCTLRLVDPSCSMDAELEHGVDFRCFIPPQNRGPQLRSSGDIMLLQRVKAEMYENRLSLSGRAGIDLRNASQPRPTPCSYCLYHGETPLNQLSALKEPYNSSHAHPRALNPQEEAVLRSLRTWYRKPDAQQLGTSGYLRTIRTVSSADYWDLHCLVLDTDYRPQSDGPSIIWVWDGHDACPFPHGLTELGSVEDMPGLQPPCRLYPSSQLEARCPPLGTVMPIVVQESVVQARSPLPEKGSCIKLRNLGATIIQGQLQSVFSETSRWYTRPDLQNGILGVLKLRLANRAAISEWEGEGGRERATVIEHEEDHRVETIRSVKNGPAPSLHLILAQMIDYAPRDPKLIWREGPMTSCSSAGQSGLAPRLKLRLRDATSELDAFLFGEEALLFFFGSRNVVEAPASPGQPAVPSLIGKDLTPALGELAGTVQQSTAQPWALFSLKKYTTYVNGNETTRYQIFQTRLRCPCA